MTDQPLLSVRDLAVEFGHGAGVSRPVDGVGFEVGEREIVGIVGESGCGKSLTLLALLGLLPSGGRVVDGSITFAGRDLRGADPSVLRSLRGRQVALIPSDAGAALNPVARVGKQLRLSLRTHRPELNSQQRRGRALDALRRARLPRPEQALAAYPHELSGGMQQRSAIALGLQNEPMLLLADEPTTALDVSIQAEILRLLVQLRDELGTAIVFVTHDISTVREICDRVVVMYAGQVVEQGGVDEVLTAPRHPYTAALLGSIPPLGGVPPEQLETVPGMPPDPAAWPQGCRFHARCRRFAELGEPEQCTTAWPGSAEGRALHVACHFPSEADRVGAGR
ncbi:ABC transporter ATP-binding protein [Jiangella ureilytica]|uniref:ABC transporter ATP-binding protein n=1 Tax=Jiangella ureilytica TaxID=2530374 RepID=A0A4R4RLP2_9ACTN|nr:ABC transporter ATP-binding protein [Jiangella ureilytica]TDC50316.1 ABC transporter ATP-binding protein [Jiangella ureilytica]